MTEIQHFVFILTDKNTCFNSYNLMEYRKFCILHYKSYMTLLEQLLHADEQQVKRTESLKGQKENVLWLL